jgi:hypothetical protein
MEAVALAVRGMVFGLESDSGGIDTTVHGVESGP